jgi:hypothetical protein
MWDQLGKSPCIPGVFLRNLNFPLDDFLYDGLNWTPLDALEAIHTSAKGIDNGNFLRRLALPKSVKQWSLRAIRDKLIKIGAKVVSRSRYVIFQMGEVAVLRMLFQEILDRISQLRFFTIPARPG